MLAECRQRWAELSAEEQRRVHLVCLPMDDVDENAHLVNALQRRADVVVQERLQEGFGLTITEAMRKARPVVASTVGGVCGQIIDGVDGLVLRDPTDLDGLGAMLGRVLEDLARRLATALHPGPPTTQAGGEPQVPAIRWPQDLVGLQGP